MGAYLSQPITKKDSSDHEGSNVSCGSSSMQGWRIHQEDAHNVIIDFDEKKSLFAVYDGHGGSEVAIYTSKHLPRFIKNTEEYKKGNYKQALINAFMEFDENLIKDEVMAVLKDLKKENEGDDSYPATDEDALDDDDGDNVNNLYEEATMPLSEVISRYRNPGIQRLKESGGKPMSPRLNSKDKKSIEEGGEGCSSSSSSARSSGVTGSLPGGSSSSCTSSSSSSSPKSSKVSKSDAPSSSNASSSSAAASSSKPEPSSATSSTQPPTPTASTDEASSTSSVKDEKVANGPAASSVSSSKPEANGSEKKENGETNGGAKPAPAVAMEEEAVISSSDVKPLKAKDKPIIVVTNGDSEADSSAAHALTNGSNKEKRTSPRKTLGTKNLLDSTMGDDSSESDEDFQIDEDLQGSSSDSDEGDEHIIAAARNLPEIDSDEEDEDDEEAEEEEDSDEEDSDYEEGEGGALSPEDLQKRMKEALDHKDVPGMDSGCTAVVVLFVDNQIYIANAGDSRAVLCRGPMALDLSEDHKPEDEVEWARIVKAGGEVTPDGRVNGGLNLSRALGDHSYKQTKTLPLSEQMITALPDVTVKTLQPDDKFIVIACDGIWNSLSSQEVVDFIRERIDKPDKKLSTICEELFDKCLAPDSLGDGTGCDNMTCVLVRLNGNQGIESHAHSSSSAQTATTKRTREELDEEEAKPSAKKTKTDAANEAAEAVAKITEEESKVGGDEPMSVESTTAAAGSAKSTTSESTEEVGSST